MVLGPRLSDVNRDLAAVGRQIDVYGLSGAVIAILAERLMQEAKTTDQGRLMALSESARLWTQVADKWSAMQADNAKPVDVSPSRPSGSPMPFDIGAFERRKEPAEEVSAKGNS